MTPEVKVNALTTSNSFIRLPDLHAELLGFQDLFNKGSLTDIEKTHVLSCLDQNFSEYKRAEPLMSLALYLYGRCIYGKDYALSAVTLRLSLEWQIEESTRFTHYASFSDIKREPFNFEKIDDLLSKVKEPDMMLILTLKWYAFACMNSREVGNASQLVRFEDLYSTIKSFCARLNTKDSNWEIGQIIYNSRPICGWKKPEDYEAQLAWIKAAEPYIELEGQTERARTFRAQLLSMESNLLSRVPQSEELHDRRLELARRAYKISQETPDFDPFLKLKFLNDLAANLSKAYMIQKEGISKEEILTLFKQLVDEVLRSKNVHEYHAIYLINASDFDLHQKQYDAAIKLLYKAESIARACHKKDQAAKTLKKIAVIEEARGNSLKAKELNEEAAKLEAAP